MSTLRLPIGLGVLVRDLEQAHGAPTRPIPRTPFQWVLWENVAYLVDDEIRAAAFRELGKRVGFDPRKLAGARPEILAEIARGMRPQDRALRLLECAEIALELGGGDLSQILALPTAKAMSALKRFPGIGAPGAEKILMLCGALPVLALESNGLRVLLRLGHGRDEPKNYSRTYRSVREALAPDLPADAAWLGRAHQLLRRHGQEVCRNTAPDCEACCVSARCPSSRA